MNISPIISEYIKPAVTKAPAFKERTIQQEMQDLLETVADLYGRASEQYRRLETEYNERFPRRASSQQNSAQSQYVSSSYDDYEELPPSYTYNNIIERNNGNNTRSENREMSRAERNAFLDRLHRFDYFGSMGIDSGIALELMGQIVEHDFEDVSHKVNYFRSQGRRLIEGFGGNWLIQLKEDELLQDMKINGLDYYVTLGGILLVDSKRCPEYQIIDDNDVADDYYDPMFAKNPRYLWVNGLGKIEMRGYNDLDICKNIRQVQTTYHFSDENYYFRVLDGCREQNHILIKDVNGIYYSKFPPNKLPSGLQDRQIYMNLRDGSLHTLDSEAFRGGAFTPTSPNTQLQGGITTATPESNRNSGVVPSGDIQTAAKAGNVTPNPPPFTFERMEYQLASTDPKMKTFGFEDLIKYIDSDGFDPNYKDDCGRNVIHLSMVSKDERIKTIISKALAKGVDINAVDCAGQTALMKAIKNLVIARNDDEKFADLAVIKFILDQNPDIEIQDQNKQTAFHLICMTTSVALLTLMLSKNPNILLKDVLGKRGADYFKTDDMRQAYQKYINS